MKIKYDKVILSDIAMLYDSLHQTPKYSDDGYPMVRVTDIKYGYINLSNSQKVSEEVYKEFTKKYHPKQGDILFSRVGSYGNSSFVKYNRHFCLGQNTVCISSDRTKIDPFYLYFCLNSYSIKEQVDSFVGGSSQPTISLKNIKCLEIPVPPLLTQQKIAGILSAYDDLIENNTRRIEILEEMARMLYREWFVKFRFPGHEAVQFVESELGLIPEGWEVVNIGKIAKVKGGKRLPKGKVVLDNKTNHPYIRVKDMNDSGLEISDIKFIDDETYQSIKRYTISSEDIYISIAGTIGRVGCIPKALSGANLTENAAKICEINFIYQKLLLNFLHSELGQSQIKSKVVGTSQPKLALFRIEEILLVIPPINIQEKIINFFSDCYKKIDNLKEKNINLRKTRDLLLPRLISGEIDVENLAINTGIQP